jgi:hypothetical protein
MKEKYEELRKKFPILPEYEEINKEFEIETIEKPSIQEIRKKIGEKLEFCLEILEKILNPEPGSIIDLYECKILTEKEKKTCFEIFKKTAYLYRELIETEISTNKEEQKRYAQNSQKKEKK